MEMPVLPQEKKNQEILSNTNLILRDKLPPVFVDASYMNVLVSWIREQFVLEETF